jgi:glycerophosphoryl diester phosphodiesterase
LYGNPVVKNDNLAKSDSLDLYGMKSSIRIVHSPRSSDESLSLGKSRQFPKSTKNEIIGRHFIAVLVFLATFQIAALAQTKHIVVIAHRGEHLHHPENTIPAFEAAVAAGADFFELDVRTTSDGKLVLMHDSTVDRMTNGKGAVSALTFDEIRKLEVGLKMGTEFAGTRVPTFDGALAFAHGKIGVYVDSKHISPHDAVDALTRRGMLDQVVVYGGRNYLKEVSTLEPKLKVMPEAENPTTLRSLLELLPLKVAAFDAKDFTDETIAVAKGAKVAIYVDRLGGADNQEGWQNAIDRGAAGIQTDHPAELVAYLKSKNYR